MKKPSKTVDVSFPKGSSSASITFLKNMKIHSNLSQSSRLSAYFQIDLNYSTQENLYNNFPFVSIFSEHGECRNKIADVVFAIDTSESIWEEDFQQQLDFVTHIVQQFDIGHDRVRVGMITFGSTVHHQFHLKDFHEKRKLISEILTVKYVGGGTNTAGAIAHARNVMFKHTNGGRDNADKILIVITDGFSKNTTKAAMEASICRNVGIKIFTIGVGHGVDNFELTAIANRPSDRNEKFSLRVDDFDGLKEIEMEVADEICKGMTFKQDNQNNTYNVFFPFLFFFLVSALYV